MGELFFSIKIAFQVVLNYFSKVLKSFKNISTVRFCQKQKPKIKKVFRLT